jgi:hypothetical protein
LAYKGIDDYLEDRKRDLKKLSQIGNKPKIVLNPQGVPVDRTGQPGTASWRKEHAAAMRMPREKRRRRGDR